MHHSRYPLSKLISNNSTIAFGCMGLGEVGIMIRSMPNKLNMPIKPWMPL
ncbi:hypothetical protein RT723_14135 [Psychrosphaera aquimarina]|uniref:Uncharacterized protein n=1 Tax=Psychrosphaera aquimarina TaxID=2044854 RepID=A0ABU3R3T7_9GAMM|nr:hypothetical protein [Psychrosphaera aquimarina]MDU0114110.1 hypothetical protein [Psychrosphaera aquimarina]